MVKLDATGHVLWSRVVGAAGSNDRGYGVIESEDEDFIYFTGRTDGFGISNPIDAVVGKLNASDGSLMWVKLYGGAG